MGKSGDIWTRGGNLRRIARARWKIKGGTSGRKRQSEGGKKITSNNGSKNLSRKALISRQRVNQAIPSLGKKSSRETQNCAQGVDGTQRGQGGLRLKDEKKEKRSNLVRGRRRKEWGIVTLQGFKKKLYEERAVFRGGLGKHKGRGWTAHP